jgi:hypothetical protein
MPSPLLATLSSDVLKRQSICSLFFPSSLKRSRICVSSTLCSDAFDSILVLIQIVW